MTEHVCEWRFGEDEFGRLIFVCGGPDCDLVLKPEDAIARLNEYETLKKATERLSARRVHGILEDRKLYSQDVLALHEYANILEGKDETAK